MSDDLLERATAALREETAAVELRSGLTRARVLQSAAKAKRKWRLRWIAPFVLTFGASTALAHVTHRYFPAVWNAVVPAALEQPAPAPRAEAERAKPRRKPRKPALGVAALEPAATPAPIVAAPVEDPRAITPPTAVPAAPTAVPAAPTAAPAAPRPAQPPALGKRHRPAHVLAPAPAIAAREPVVAPAAEAEPAPAPAPAVESGELALFRRAMKLHDAHDAAAIRAWDDFLRVAPRSPLATEARYHRALGLVRAGRAPEARAALAPFARGDFAGYRRREARELLDALR